MMYFAYPNPLVLLLYALILLAILLAIFGVAIYGTIAGCGAIVIEIEARWWPDRRSKTSLRNARRYGWHALIAGSVLLGLFAAIAFGLDGDLRFVLIAEPALLLGGIAILLTRLLSQSRGRVFHLMALVAWVGLMTAAPSEVLTFQLNRELRTIIAEARQQLTSADEIMRDGYEHAVRTKHLSVHDDQTRRWARIGLEEAQAGLQATHQLIAQTRNGTSQQDLAHLSMDFARQTRRYENFIRGFGEIP